MTNAGIGRLDSVLKRAKYSLSTDAPGRLAREYTHSVFDTVLEVAEPDRHEIELYAEFMREDPRFVQDVRLMLTCDPVRVYGGDTSGVYQLGVLEEREDWVKAQLRALGQIIKGINHRTHVIEVSGAHRGEIFLPTEMKTLTTNFK